jgi:hypothetical protein
MGFSTINENFRYRLSRNPAVVNLWVLDLDSNSSRNLTLLKFGCSQSKSAAQTARTQMKQDLKAEMTTERLRHENFSSIGVRECLLMAQTPIADAEHLLPVTNDYSLEPMPVTQSLPYQAYLHISRGPFSCM